MLEPQTETRATQLGESITQGTNEHRHCSFFDTHLQNQHMKICGFEVEQIGLPHLDGYLK